MTNIYVQLALGIILAAIIAAGAYYAHALNRSGALAAFVLGTVIFGIGGLNWAILLMAFFIPSSLLSAVFKKQKKTVEADFAKGSRRDAGQVAANGAIAGLCALVFPLLGQPGWLWAAAAGALAAASADTWATEIGVLGKRKPRLITTGKPVEPGTSGGVSLAGFAAALAGSALLAVFAVVLKPTSIPNTLMNNLVLFTVVILGGLDGSILDSILGAVAQAMYYCDKCQKETEKFPTHSCGSPTRHIRGQVWMNNDWVNTFCTINGGLLAAILAGFLLSSPLPDLSNGGAEMMNLTVSSPAFASGQPIPSKYTCDGGNTSPALTWGDVPQNARSLALIVDDPDAPMGTYTHWVVYNLPPDINGLSEGQPAGTLSNGGTQGTNSSRNNAYFGPCPPPGKPHRYFFKLYALDIDPSLAPVLSVEKLTSAMAGHVLAQGEWMGTYKR
jgi:Raf kinase inhibitor-like YbhB/YbcL family protein/uncharacterized protein (TIGR00297 family)